MKMLLIAITTVFAFAAQANETAHKETAKPTEHKAAAKPAIKKGHPAAAATAPAAPTDHKEEPKSH